MNQRHIGVIVLVIGIVTAGLVLYQRSAEERRVNAYVAESGTCFLPDGTCLHEETASVSTAGFVIAASLLLLGAYLIFFDRTQRQLAEQHLEVSKALREASEREKQKDEFSAFLSAFNEQEQKVLRAVREQDGILQSTLRYRTGMSKTALSLMLKTLEEKGHISRTPAGKTNKVFLRS